MSSSLENVVSLHTLASISSALLESQESFGLDTFSLFSESSSYPEIVTDGVFHIEQSANILNSNNLPGLIS